MKSLGKLIMDEDLEAQAMQLEEVGFLIIFDE